MKTAIVTDSTASLTPAELQQYNIHMVPLSVIFGEETYEEDVTITASAFFAKLKEEKELPKTTQPPIGKFVQLFEELAKDYDEILTIHLSSGISGTYQGAIQAGNMVEGVDVYAYDSEVACAMQGFFAIYAAQLAAKGYSAKEIVEKLDEKKETMRAFFIVDDLTNLQRGGRLSSAAALIGGMLQIKPILFFEDTVIKPFEKVRTQKKAIKRVESMLAEAAQKYEYLEATVIHADCEDKAQALIEDFTVKYPNVEFKLSYFGPVVGTHLGEGAIGIGWFEKQ